ncbi:MAG: hypothetical protein IKD79_01690 [Oscillospiraceae bacterium]|nr:hypothetical protein [Oscillospiraceae bacterium]
MITIAGSVEADGDVWAEYYGLSTDTKPTNAGNGALFFEMDTSELYVFDAENALWRQVA